MKKNVLYIIEFFALLAAVLLMLFFIGSDRIVLCTPAPAASSANPGISGSDADIEADELTMSEGEQLSPTYSSAGGSPVWSSSNNMVVSCENGVLTAHRCGEATVTIMCGGSSDSVRVTVSGDIKAELASVVGTLASDGSGIDTLRELGIRLERCNDPALDSTKSLAEALLSFFNGTGNRDVLCQAIEAGGLDEITCLDAASCCWSSGLRERSAALVSLTGDCTLAAYNEKFGAPHFPGVYAEQSSLTYPFDRVRNLFLTDDLTVINFEGTLTEHTDHYDKAFYFRGSPAYAAILPAAGIDAAALANNHSYDYGEAGYRDTVKYISEAGTLPVEQYAPQEIPVTLSDGSSIRVILFTYSLVNNHMPHAPQSLLDQITEYKKAPGTVVIVTVHWGIEYDEICSLEQITHAHELVDAGADLVAGHHPHILQGIECYKGRYIAYSLGNFAFGGNASSKNPQTVIIQAAITGNADSAAVSGIYVIPCSTTSSGGTVNNYQPCRRYGDQAEEVISLLLRCSKSLEYGVSSLNTSGL